MYKEWKWILELPFTPVMLAPGTSSFYVRSYTGEEWRLWWCGSRQQLEGEVRGKYLLPSYNDLLEGHVNPTLKTRLRRFLRL